MTVISDEVKEAKKKALHHSLQCEKLIVECGLKAAIEYAGEQGIEPPQCSLESQSTNADKMRATASRMLCETKWWARRLKNQSLRKSEVRNIKQGLVSDGVSDDLVKYHKANK